MYGTLNNNHIRSSQMNKIVMYLLTLNLVSNTTQFEPITTQVRCLLKFEGTASSLDLIR